jgi:hypothetical protein
LPVPLMLFVWFQSEPLRLWWIPAGFIAIEAILLHQPALAYSNFYSIWLPSALALLYWAGERIHQGNVISRQLPMP